VKPGGDHISHWWLDHVLPGTISGTAAGVILSLPVWIHHRLIRRHIDRQTSHLDDITAGQSAWIDSLTAEQTAALERRRLIARRKRRPRP